MSDKQTPDAVREAYMQGQVDMRERAAQLCDQRGAEEQEGFGLVRGTQNYFRARNAIRDLKITALSTLSADAIRQGEGETLALRAIKAVTATAKDGAAGLSRIMAIASAAGVKQQYSELLQDPDVALIVERPRTEWAHLFKPGIEGCALSPDGWQCSRARGHSGPCAATPASHASDGGKA